MAVLIPSLLPPPAPFKLFVLLAGVGGISLPRFALAVGIGRGLRYLALGLLAIRYGDSALAYLHENAGTASLVLIALLAAGAAGYYFWSRAKAGQAR